MLRFRGCEEFRQRIALSCVSGKPIRVDDIRSDDEAPGLRGFEASLLRLTEKISNGCVVEINETGAPPAPAHAALLSRMQVLLQVSADLSVRCNKLARASRSSGMTGSSTVQLSLGLPHLSHLATAPCTRPVQSAAAPHKRDTH